LGELFGTDGVRGVANQDLIPELAFKLGRAGASVLEEKTRFSCGDRNKIFIGRDTRISGDMLAAALAAGINSLGIDTVDLEVVPTPAVSYLSRSRPVIGGIMVSASHNPIQDNGIKFFDSRGMKISEEMESEIEARLEAELARPTHEKVGRQLDGRYLIEFYLDSLLASYAGDISGLSVVLDCGHGAAHRLGPRILKRAGLERAKVINHSGRGELINVDCGSTNTAELKETVLAENADLGIALDGDADRAVLIDEQGREIDGDYIIYICGSHLSRRGRLKGNRVVTTRYSNLGLAEALKKSGVEVIYAANGDKYVLEKIQELNLSLGGEKSGHIIFKEHNVSGDGMLTALKVMEVMIETGKSLSQLAEGLKEWPQLLKNIRVKNKELLEENSRISEVVAAGERDIQDGRIFVRASGTEPVIRLMLEGRDRPLLEKWGEQIAGVIGEELN